MNQAFRLATALWGASLLVSTTRLEEVLDSAERFTARRGRPLLAAGTIALCYMPLLVERAGRIAIARRARGEDDSRGLFNRLHRLAGSALPLFAAALRDAESLAEAMQARCYEPTSPRQPFRMTSFRLREAGISACAFTLTAVSMLGVI
jgi:energy-coupling factor transporter transmembrane protein EcfT